MGKNHKEQRTKGNTRPSSSGHTASLLFSSGLGTIDSKLVPLQQLLDDISAVDPDISLCFKRMIKRDAVTKTKAVLEFSQLCQEKDGQVLQAVLPVWTRLYNRLCLEPDYKVREATHAAQESLVQKVGRGIAPHLKSIMAIWLVSQCDPHSPAASLAQASFRAAFVPEKQPEALSYCKKEIFSFIVTNLLDFTLHSSATDPSNPDGPRSLHLVSCCLNGLGLFLSKVPEVPPNLLSDPKFWKLAKNKNTQIRASWYRLLARLCHALPQLANEHAAHIAPAALSHLSESDPQVAPALWEAVLYALTTLENCWQHVNCQKTVLPQLWALLKEGGNGSASSIYPNLLPLLACLPPALVEPCFFRTFFSHFATGLSKAQADVGESQKVLRAYLECLRWAIKKDPSLVRDKFQPWLYSVLSDPESQLCTPEHLGQVREFICAVDQEQLWEELQRYCTDHSSIIRCRMAALLCCSSDNPHLRRLVLHVCRQLLTQDSDNQITLASLVKTAPSVEFFSQLCDPPQDLYWRHLKPAVNLAPATEIILELLAALPDLPEALEILLDLSKLSSQALGLLLEGLVHRRPELVERWVEDGAAMATALAELGRPPNLEYLQQGLRAVGPPLACALLASLPSPPSDLAHHCRLLSAAAPHCQQQGSQLKAPTLELFSLACRQQEDHGAVLEDCLQKCWNMLQCKEECLQEMGATVHLALVSGLTQQGFKPLLRTCQFVLDRMASESLVPANFVSWMLPSSQEWDYLYLGLKPQKVCPDCELQEPPSSETPPLTEGEVKTSPLLVAAFCSSILQNPAALCGSPDILTAALPPLFCIHYSTLQEEESEVAKLLSENLGQLRTSQAAGSILSGLLEWSKQKGCLASLALKEELSRIPKGLALLEKSQALCWDNGSPHTLQVLAQLGAFPHRLRPTLLQVLKSTPPEGRSEMGLLASFLSALSPEEVQEDVGLLICHLQDLLKEYPEAFVSHRTISEASEEVILWNCSLARCLEACLLCPKALSKTSWEKLLCLVGEWVTAIEKHSAVANPRLMVRVFSLVAAIHRVIVDIEELKVDWEEFFSPLITKVLLAQLFALAEDQSFPEVVDALAIAVAGVPDSSLSPELMERLLQLVRFSKRSVKMASHNLILRLIPPVPQEEQAGEIPEEEEEENLVRRLLPARLVDIMEHLGREVQEMVASWPLGNCAELRDQTSLSTVTSYLLGWNVALQMLASLYPSMRYQVANSLSDTGLLASFLENLFHLMPSRAPNKAWFQQGPSCSPLDGRLCSALEVQHLACHLYCETLSHLPAASRRWWNNLERRDKDLVDRYTTTWVSGVVINREIGSSNYTLDNLMVKLRPSIRAVSATYTMEDVTTELEVSLPLNHPLGLPNIEANQRIRVRAQQWRVWLRQLNTFLLQQNGSILEGLVLWKKNIDKAFQGIEECTICYYVLHGSTGLLPKLKCQVCHKNFHSTCLFKWFKTSTSAKCPHCRETFW